ncbi:MAG TPA: hypothetical protein VIH42_10255 [Thermoguttaceae bacterium]
MPAILELTAKEDISEKLFKLEQQNQRLIQQNRELTRVSRDGFTNVRSSIEGGITSIGRMTLSLTGVAGIVGSIKIATSEWLSHLKEVGQEQEKIRKQFGSIFGRTQDLPFAAQIEDWSFKVKGLSKGQTLHLFEGVSSANQDLQLKQRQKIVEAAAPLMPIIGEENLQTFGRQIGKFAEIRPGLSPEAIVGLSLKARQIAGEHAEELAGNKARRVMGTLTAAGMEPETAMAMMISGMKAGQVRAGAVISAAEAIDKEWKKEKPKGAPLTAEQKAKNRFATADKAERLRLLHQDKEVREAILGDQALQFVQVRPEDYSKIAQELKTAESAGFVPGQVELAKRAPGLAKQYVGMETTTRGKIAQTEEKKQADLLAMRDKEFYESYLPRVSQESGLWKRFLSTWWWEVSKAYTKNPLENLPPMGPGGVPALKELYTNTAENERQIRHAETIQEYLRLIAENTTGLKTPNPSSVQENRRQHGEK